MKITDEAVEAGAEMTDNIKDGKVYGCHVDLCDDEAPDGCVLDYGAPEDCIYARLPSGNPRRSKWGCPHWRAFRIATEAEG